MEREVDAYCGPRVRLVEVEHATLALNDAMPEAKSPNGAARILQQFIAGKDRECLMTIHLDARHRALSVEVVSIGTLTMAPVHPREVFKAAILSNAAAIIIGHNHPSGDIEPSPEDEAVLERLHEAGKVIGIPLLDFLIVSGSDHWSARETFRWPS